MAKPQTIPILAADTKSFTINIYAALAILGGAILTTAVVTAFGVASTLNTDHFLLQSTATAVAEFKTSYVRTDVYSSDQKYISDTLGDIKTNLIEINRKLK